MTGTMRFAARAGRWFWANGGAWGTCEVRETGDGTQVAVEVLHGSLALKQLDVAGVGTVAPDARMTIGEGERVSWRL